MQTQMNNRFEEEIVIFLTCKHKGNTTSDTFHQIFSVLVPSILYCCHTLPMESLPSSHDKPSWILLALTKYVYNYRPTALLPYRLCTPPMATLMAFHHKRPCQGSEIWLV